MNSGFGLINYFVVGTVTANSAETGLGPTNLSLPQCDVASAWQTRSGVVTPDAGALLRCDAPTPGTIFRGFGLFRTNLTTSAIVVFTVWRVVDGEPVAQGGITVEGPMPGFGQVVAILDDDLTGDFVQIEIYDEVNPDSHISIGGAFAGPMWFPERGVMWESSYMPQSKADRQTSDGGQVYITPRYRQRSWSVAFGFLSDAEAWDDFDTMLRVADGGANILFILDQTSVDMNRDAIFGSLVLQTPISFPNRVTDARAATVAMIEAL